MKHLIPLFLLLSSCTQKPTEFYLNEPVIVISGFYKGCWGVIREQSPYREDRYMLKFSNCDGGFYFIDAVNLAKKTEWL